MDTANLHTACAFAAGLALTLFLAAYLTPRRWWRRANARALLIMVLGAWGFGSLILYAFHGTPALAAAPAAEATPTATPAPTIAAQPWEPIAGRPFRVHRALNLRAAAGVHAARLVTVPAGTDVTPTGMRDGDWWQVTTGAGGRDSTGWVSSLWLRRDGE
nr:SH3 domain-containing protein [uncultured Duganella sp.]